MAPSSNLYYGDGMPVRVREPRRLLIVLAAALGLALGMPLAALGERAPEAHPRAGSQADAAKPFTLDLYGRGDFVAQANFVQCVGASMQMMLNMIRPENDRTAATQLDLQNLARSMSGQRPDGIVRKGASVRGWTAGLNTLGAGPYRTVGSADIQAALKIAARAIRETNRPVGLLVWRGRHAWVMAGFTATADPRLTDDFEVTAAIVLDPLYPHGSTVWGPSPKPGASLSVTALGRQFVPRGYRTSLPGGDTDPSPTAGPFGARDTFQSWSQGLAGKFVIVAPYALQRFVRVGHWAS
jgi:hypothetical protein